MLVPNNNTSSCMRVYGLSFGNGDGAGALGVPFRDKSCDYEQAADDAAAMGQHEIAWWWRCHKKNLYRTFSGDSKELQHLACWNSMVQMLNAIEPEPEPVPTGQVIIPEEEYEGLLMAQVQQEEIEAVEDRLAQQENLIDALQEEIEDHESEREELERLKREAAALRAAQEAEEEERESVREQFRRRLAEREQGQEDEQSKEKPK